MRLAKPLLAVLLLAGLTAAVICLPVADWLSALLDRLAALGPWGPVLLALAYVPLTVLMVPGTVPTLGAGFAFGVAWGTLAVSIGSVLGSAAAFLIGRHLTRDWVRAQVARRPRLAAVDAAVAREGFRICLLVRLSPAFPYNLMGYVFGATKIRFRDHFFASWVGMLPGTILYVYLGSTARTLTDAATGTPGGDVLRYVLVGTGLLLTVVVTTYVARVARRAVAELVPVA